MICPKCRSEMPRVSYESVEVNRCVECDGLWFDLLELERLKELGGSEQIDIGDRLRGHALDDRDQIDCPVCRTRLIRMVDARQPHIRYESCPVCYGAFFDAGEFRDYKEHDLFDVLRALLAKERT